MPPISPDQETLINQLDEKIKKLSGKGENDTIPVSFRMPVRRYKALLLETKKRIKKGKSADVGNVVNQMVDHALDSLFF